MEDNPRHAQLAQMLLARAPGSPYQVTAATQCQQACEFLRSESFDVILLDLGLPDSLGLDGLDRILVVAGETPVVVLTSVEDRELALEALHRGAQDYVNKGALQKEILHRAISYASQRKRAEQRVRDLEAQVLQAQKMEALGRLAGGVAHDFNNLLTVILGSCDLLQEGLRPSHEAAVADIRNAATRASSLTTQILSFSRTQVPDLSVLDLGEFLLGVRENTSRLLGESIRLETQATPGETPIRASVPQLEQVCMNLALNARDAMPRGGRLLVEVPGRVSPGPASRCRTPARG